ncbi:MAG: dTDP-4-dehydrorhamnose reductase [Gammaproteobacteria bacterium]|jgi:dTDP-4-dehydrorhamnose reductase
MNILLLGANGQIGWELKRTLAPLGQLKVCDRQTVNLENTDELLATVQDYCPTVIVNAAAYTAVDKAESEPEKAYRINAEAVKLLANEASRLNAWLIHYSTDYIFDGTKKGAYIETDVPNPLSIYGKTKLQGEEAIKKSGCKHIIFRSSWVYAAHGANFVKTIIRLAKERDEIKVVADQFGTPTSAEMIADITALSLRHLTHKKEFAEQLSGTYHLTATGETSWHGFAKYVVAEAQKCGIILRAMPENVTPISTSEYPLPAIRPANSRLDSQKLVDTFAVNLPPWQTHAQRMISETSQQVTS